MVVATGLVREARSKSVDGATAKSKSAPKLSLDGAPLRSSRYTKVPNDFSASNLLCRVTASEAAGKERCSIALRRMEKAAEKRAS